MKTLSTRTLRFANLVALAAAMVAVCPRTTNAETGVPSGPGLPPPCIIYPDGTTIYATASAPQPDGSTTYSNATVTWSSGATKSATWANISTSGAILFSDGTTGTI
jgi:hypothetical protein